jgi:hypothetical protein
MVAPIDVEFVRSRGNYVAKKKANKFQLLLNPIDLHNIHALLEEDEPREPIDSRHVR